MGVAGILIDHYISLSWIIPSFPICLAPVSNWQLEFQHQQGGFNGKGRYLQLYKYVFLPSKPWSSRGTQKNIINQQGLKTATAQLEGHILEQNIPRRHQSETLASESTNVANYSYIYIVYNI